MTKLKHKLDDFLKLNISNKNKSITHTRIGDKTNKIYGCKKWPYILVSAYML